MLQATLGFEASLGFEAAPALLYTPRSCLKKQTNVTLVTRGVGWDGMDMLTPSSQMSHLYCGRTA